MPKYKRREWHANIRESMFVTSRLPGKWRNEESIGHLEEFVEKVLAKLFYFCRKVQCERTHVVTEDVARMAFVAMGWSQSLEGGYEHTEGKRYWMTKQALTQSLRRHKISVRQPVKNMIGLYMTHLLYFMTKYAKPLQTPVTTSVEQVLRRLRRRAMAESNEEE